MTSAIIGLTKALLLAIVAVSAIASLYAAIDTINVHSGHSVFVSGIVSLGLLAFLNPLFCFVAAWGMIHYLDMGAGQAIAVVLPVGLAWSFAAMRMLARKAGFASGVGAG